MRKRLRMVGWYDPLLLIRTGIRAVISKLFGQFADKREAIAAGNAIQATPADGEFDYSGALGRDGFWFDYLADTGDGWNPAYAMARLVGQEAITLDEHRLPRGRLLILGGDQVYPTASREQYEHRFLGPYEQAFEAAGGPDGWKAGDGRRPDLYAIPGNHDWYDGLNSFLGLFCRRRVTRPGVDLGTDRPGKVIGGRQTRQTRSYFAIQLPQDWWVWGTDCQLEGYIDQPQIDYFQHAARYWMKPGSKLILCVAEPAWIHAHKKNPAKKFSSFSYLERLAGAARKPLTPAEIAAGKTAVDEERMGHRLKLVLTGDSHHYARYVEDDRHYVVCGGGGAFLHPTHQLRDNAFDYEFGKPGGTSRQGGERRFEIAKKPDGKPALFPSRGRSWLLSFGNLFFFWHNKAFVAAFAAAYALFNWTLDFAARVADRGSLSKALRDGGYDDSLATYWSLVFTSPTAFLLVALAGLGYVAFAKSPYSMPLKAAMGLTHAAAQAAAVTAVTCAVVRCTDSVALATLASALASGIVFGLYLLTSLGLLRRHANEAFSSMRIEGYKSFLRLHIGAKGKLTVYPVGLAKVPRDSGEEPCNPPLAAELIEPPVVVA
ncbi:MAG TPA: hypothetical protein VF693_00595 [Allosphingosinicella sp.]